MSVFDRLFKKPGPVEKPVGIRIRYTGDDLHLQASRMYLVPCMWLPFPKGAEHDCPTCRTVHPVKTVHLSLDSSGACIVSRGVLDTLRRAGLEVNQLEVVDSTDAPPPLVVDGNKSRRQLDQMNERIVDWRHSG